MSGGPFPEFNHIPDRAHGQALLRCALCGAKGEMWEVVDGTTAQKSVMCGRSEAGDGPIGPLAECPLSLPPVAFRMPTYREAAKCWNSFGEACAQSRTDAAFRSAT